MGIEQDPDPLSPAGRLQQLVQAYDLSPVEPVRYEWMRRRRYLPFRVALKPLAYRGEFTITKEPGGDVSSEGGFRAFVWATPKRQLVIREEQCFQWVDVRDLALRLSRDDYELLVMYLEGNGEQAKALCMSRHGALMEKLAADPFTW